MKQTSVSLPGDLIDMLIKKIWFVNLSVMMAQNEVTNLNIRSLVSSGDAKVEPIPATNDPIYLLRTSKEGGCSALCVLGRVCLFARCGKAAVLIPMGGGCPSSSHQYITTVQKLAQYSTDGPYHRQ